MAKQSSLEMLVYSMEKMVGYSPPDRVLPKHLVKEGMPGKSYSDIISANNAYGSRKNGINERTNLPSAYRVYIGDGFLSFSCNQLKCRQHTHFAIQLVFNFDAPLLLNIDGSQENELFFFIIPAFIPHHLNSPAGKHLSILVDPLSDLGSKLNTLFEDPVSFTAFNRSVMDSVYPFIQTRLFEFETANFLNNTIERLNGMVSKLPESHIDDRIRHSVNRSQVRIKSGENVRTRDLAVWTSLSEGRARHLFKEQTGVSFTQYLKWLRIMEAIKYACASGGSLTEAAHMAGFSDSAHFSRMFKDMFGLAPSSVLQ